jgi:hypothetical protein
MTSTITHSKPIAIAKKWAKSCQDWSAISE